VLERIVHVGNHLLQLNNFNGVMQIIAALSKTEITRLRKTSKLLPKDVLKSLDLLRKMLEQNCARLRVAYKNSSPPCLPYIGTFLTDLTFIGEMKPRLKNGMINYRKLKLQADALEGLLGRRSQLLYELREVKEVKNFLSLPAKYNSEEAYQRSLEIEP
jgi:son of sevenless-like protein